MKSVNSSPSHSSWSRSKTPPTKRKETSDNHATYKQYTPNAKNNEIGSQLNLIGVILKATSGKTSHDSLLVDEHIKSRAADSVNEHLKVLMSKLELTHGSNQSHRATAYSQLLSVLMRDLDATIFSEDRKKLSAVRGDFMASKEEFGRKQEMMSLRIAQKDQRIVALEAECAALDNKNKTLIRTVELLHKELEKVSQSLSETQQKAVELRMQGWDFKGEVDRRCNKIIASVQTRMGFVPSGIHKQIALLQVLKPPGDPAYDQVRHQANRIRKKVNNNHLQRSVSVGSPISSSSAFGLSRSVEGSFGSVPLVRSFSVPVSTSNERNDQEGYQETRDFVYDGEQEDASDMAVVTQPPSTNGIAFDKHRFQKFLNQTAQNDRNLYLAKIDYLPRGTAATGLSSATDEKGDHRRMSATSSASGCTDRRSSTSSAGGFALSPRVPWTEAAVEDDNDSATGVSKHNLSVNLRKPWSYDNLMHSGSESMYNNNYLHPRVTTTAASVPLSASSDQLHVDDTNDLVSQSSYHHRENLSYLQHSNSKTVSDPKDGQYDEFVDLGTEDDEFDDDHEVAAVGDDGVVVDKVHVTTNGKVNVKSDTSISRDTNVQEQRKRDNMLKTKDIAGAHALRKAGTVSPKAIATKKF